MKTVKLAMVTVGAALLLGGCSYSTLSPNWGAAYQQMRASQVLDPAAGEQLEPVEGQDGRINATAMEAYRKGFEKPDAEFDRSIVSSGVKTK